MACQDSDRELEVLLCVFLVELRTRNILVGPDLMYEIYHMCRELYMNCHGVLKSVYLRSVHT